MYNTRNVTLTIRLPDEIADQLVELQEHDPVYLARIVQYGLLRRSIYRHLRNRGPDEPVEPAIFPGRDHTSEQHRQVLAENPGTELSPWTG